jgi:predicted TIM-barrel fold metal-dependent hydrolase
MSSLHKTQTILRYLPEPARRALDEVSGLAPIPTLLVESTVSDLTEAMDEASVDRALVIAHPPFISNEFVLEHCAEDSRLLPVVNVPSGTSKPGNVLRGYVTKGAVALKIHPAADGEGADSPRYRALLKVADELGLPVILHTGCIHTHLFYKDPDQGQAQRYAPWFENYKNVRFVLAHMNFHDPNIAFDLMEEHANLYTDTSWQPAETIGEAVRRVGAERILFGTDWPFVGNNLTVGLARVRDCVESGTLTEEQASMILGENSTKLFNLTV